MSYILVLFFVLSCTILPVIAVESDDTKDSYTIIRGDGSKEEKVADNSSGDAGKIASADEIYSDDIVLGQKKSSGSLSDLFDVDSYLSTIFAFGYLRAAIMLTFAIVGGIILISYPATILWNALKKIIASKGENHEHAVAEIKKINTKDWALTTGLGLSFGLIAITIFIFSKL